MCVRCCSNQVHDFLPTCQCEQEGWLIDGESIALAQGALEQSTIQNVNCFIPSSLMAMIFLFGFLISIYRFDGTKCTAFYRFIVLLFCLNIGIELNFRRMMPKMHLHHICLSFNLSRIKWFAFSCH